MTPLPRPKYSLRQFLYIFTRQDTTTSLPNIKDKNYLSIKDIKVDENGLMKFIDNLNVMDWNSLKSKLTAPTMTLRLQQSKKTLTPF